MTIKMEKSVQKKTLGVRTTEDIYDKLFAMAKVHDITVSSLVHEILVEALKDIKITS